MKTLCVVVFTFILCGVQSLSNSRSEQLCIDYYSTGTNLDLNSLPNQMYGVYFWPPNQRDRDNCENVSFKTVSPLAAKEAGFNCYPQNFPTSGVMKQASYINNAGKLTSLLFHGNEEVKSMYRSCEKDPYLYPTRTQAVMKYIFVQVNDNYILGINCSAKGRGILYSKFLPSVAEIEAVVETIDIMAGREGKPDCKLSR